MNSTQMTSFLTETGIVTFLACATWITTMPRRRQLLPIFFFLSFLLRPDFASARPGNSHPTLNGRQVAR